MSIGKHLRFQILQRDRFKCRYCGTSAPDVVLVIDHVTPRSRGGRDVPENLITACQDCNSGKSDVMPDPWLVEEIEQVAAEWQEGYPYPEVNEDELDEMVRYQEALYELERLPAGEVLHWIAWTYQAAMPYRPTHTELIICAGLTARDRRTARAR